MEAAELPSSVEIVTMPVEGREHDSDSRHRMWSMRPEVPSQVGRYEVSRLIGRGGMGSVYRGRDPELEREVALKILDGVRGGEEASDGTSTLVREAMLQARISHPNVVAVYDVGEFEGTVYIAMELVDGVTLGTWLAQQPRTWPEIVAVYVEAARGLVAAHEQGLVHRDFKPSNVMIGHDGRVRVLDFGLAIGVHAWTPAASESSGTTSGELPSLAASAPANMGTPAFSSPEQFRGESVGPTSDQFSLCVALWEALFDQRPFLGSTPMELARNVIEGNRRPIPMASDVPRWLQDVCNRGLSSDPDRRYEDVKALVIALERGQARVRRARRRLALTSFALLGAGIWGQSQYVAQQARHSCDREGELLASVWGDEQRAALRAVSQSDPSPVTADTVERVIPRLDDYAEHWAELRAHACSQATVEHVWADELWERSEWCFDEARFHLQALTTELASGEGIHNGVLATVGLPRLQRCVYEPSLTRLVMPPPDARDATAPLRKELARFEVERALGRSSVDLDRMRTVAREAQRLGWARGNVASRLMIGRQLDALGDYEEAEEVFTGVYFDAVKQDHVRDSLEAAIELTSTVGIGLERFDDGKTWARHADGIAQRWPDPGPLDLVRRLQSQVLLLASAGELETARTMGEEVLALVVRELGPDHPMTVGPRTNLGNVYEASGEYDKAKKHFERAHALKVAMLGPKHSDVSVTLMSLGNIDQHHGRFAEARGYYERALEIRQEALGPSHPEVLRTVVNLAAAVEGEGDVPRARVLLERAIAACERRLGNRHPECGGMLGNLANLARTQKNLEESLRLHERSVAIVSEALGPRHPEVALRTMNLATIHGSMKHYERAGALFKQSLDVYEEVLGESHPRVARVAHNLAELAILEGRGADAVTWAKRARRINQEHGLPTGTVRFVEARALWSRGDAPVQALDSARSARTELKAEGRPTGEVDAWLAAHEH